MFIEITRNPGVTFHQDDPSIESIMLNLERVINIIVKKDSIYFKVDYNKDNPSLNLFVEFTQEGMDYYYMLLRAIRRNGDGVVDNLNYK
jgi:hypothetical protein